MLKAKPLTATTTMWHNNYMDSVPINTKTPSVYRSGIARRGDELARARPTIKVMASLATNIAPSNDVFAFLAEFANRRSSWTVDEAHLASAVSRLIDCLHMDGTIKRGEAPRDVVVDMWTIERANRTFWHNLADLALAGTRRDARSLKRNVKTGIAISSIAQRVVIERANAYIASGLNPIKHYWMPERKYRDCDQGMSAEMSEMLSTTEDTAWREFVVKALLAWRVEVESVRRMRTASK